MPAEPHIIYLEPLDDSVSVRDRLTFVKAHRVLLVWPKSGNVLRRKLDLLLVLRQATRLGMRIALVTPNPEVIEHARDLNISVFNSVDAATRAAWKRPRDQMFIPPRDPSHGLALADHILEKRAPSLTSTRWRNVLRWLIFIGGVLSVVAGFFLAAPSATITLTPASRQVFETVSIVADPELRDIDIEHFRMPATVVTLQATSHVTVETSGRETAGATRAQGLVVFHNKTEEPLLIPLGTIVSTSGTYPIRFETMVETTLPAGNQASVQVPIQALEAHSGADGNVAPGAINRVESEFADGVTVTNPNATYGGAIQERAVVAPQDHERLLVLGRQQVLQRARDTLLYQLTGRSGIDRNHLRTPRMDDLQRTGWRYNRKCESRPSRRSSGCGCRRANSAPGCLCRAGTIRPARPRNRAECAVVFTRRHS